MEDISATLSGLEDSLRVPYFALAFLRAAIVLYNVTISLLQDSQLRKSASILDRSSEGVRSLATFFQS